MKPKVSICIPAYKQTSFLKKCLDSIIIQDYPSYEIVITDDSPDDSISDLLQQYDFKGKLNFKRNTPALGSPANWNEGLDMARGEYIKILHHDDWFLGKGSLREYVRLLDENPGADFGFSACIWVYPDEDRQKTMIPTATQIAALRKNPASIFPENFISTPSTIIFRNNAGKQYFDKEIKWLVDSEYYFRCLMKNGNFAYTEKPLVKILIEAAHQVTSVTRGNRKTEIKEWVYFYSKIRQRRNFDINNYKHLKRVFRNFNIRDVEDLHACGVSELNKEIKSIIFYNKTRDNYIKYVKDGGLVRSLQHTLIPENSRRAKVTKQLFSPLRKIKTGLKQKFLNGEVILAEQFFVPQVVNASQPVVRGFEMDHSRCNYGSRIIIECEKTDPNRKAFGRWQINWLDGNNNFVFATFIPFELSQTSDHYISPLINNIPLFVKRGILYLTSHDEQHIAIHSFAFSGYNIGNTPLRKLMHIKSGQKRIDVKIRRQQEVKNILFIIPWMSVGGGDMVNLIIMRHLAERGYNVHIITSERSKNEWKHKFEEITRNIVVLPSFIKNAKSQHDYIDVLVQYIRKARINNLIVSNSEFGYACLPVIKNEFPALKVFDILHGQGGEREGGGFPEYSKPFDAYLDKRITINAYLKSYLIEKYGIVPGRIKVIPNCIDTNKFVKKNHARCERFTVSYVGRLSYEKHPEKILAIAEIFRLKYSNHNVSFEIIGDGPMYQELKAGIKEKGLEGLVQLKGYRENVREVLEHTDVLILCSEMEGLPIVLLEAMSMSIPCIASKVGGIPELIDDSVNGYLVAYEADNEHVFADRIGLLYQDAVLRGKLSDNARKKVESQFSITNMINGYISILEEK